VSTYASRARRFTQEDPIGLAAGTNLYQYVGNDPVGFTDPFGLAADTLEQVQLQSNSTETPGHEVAVSVSINRSPQTSERFSRKLLQRGSHSPLTTPIGIV